VVEFLVETHLRTTECRLLYMGSHHATVCYTHHT